MTQKFLDGLFLEPESFHLARLEILRNGQISVFLDCGANRGEFASHIRHSGYSGRMVSFEPASIEFANLSYLASHDPSWDCHQLALGDYDGVASFNLAGNSESSSLLPMLDRHLASAPESQYAGTETVYVSQLDTVCDEYLSGQENIYLKLDVQGNEMAALKGAGRILRSTLAIEIELALVQLYADQTLFSEMISYINQLGFRLYGYENNFVDPITGEVLEVNGIFLRV